MPHLRTCRLCIHRRDCAIKTRLLAAVRGLDVASITHRCGRREISYRMGDGVLWRTCVPAETEWDDDEWVDYAGWFVRESGTKALIYVAEGSPAHGCAEEEADHFRFSPKNNGFCAVPFSRLKPHAPPDEFPLCWKCGETPAGSFMLDGQAFIQCVQSGCPSNG